MMQGYFFKFPDEEGVFEMFFRHQPFNGGYSIFAGLDPLLDAIEKIKFSDDDLRYLESKSLFKKEFINYLSEFSFKGDIFSLKEGYCRFSERAAYAHFR